MKRLSIILLLAAFIGVAEASNDFYPWTEDFDSYTVSSESNTNNLPAGWHYINTTFDSCFPAVYNYDSHSLQNCLYFSSAAGPVPEDQYAILPEMENLGGKYVMLYAKGNDKNPSFEIGLMSDPTDADTFTPFGSQGTTGYYQEYVFSIPSGATGNYIAIRMESAGTDGKDTKIDGKDTKIDGKETISDKNELFIDDIAVSDQLRPVGLTFMNATATTATLSWTERGNATAWQVCLNDDEANLVNVASQPTCTLTGLTAGTVYNVKVRSVNAGQYSPWSMIGSFMTAITTYPWTENFDSYTGIGWGYTNNLPVGWHYINTSTDIRFCGYPIVCNFGNNSGQNCLNFYSDANNDPQDQYAILPAMENLGGKYVMLYAKGYNGTSFDIGLMTDPTDAATFEPFATQTTTLTYQEYVFSIPSDAIGNCVAIKMEKASSDLKDLYIDNIAVADILRPADLAATNETATTATLTWTERGNATAWQVYLNNDEDHLVNVASQSTCTLKGLTAGTVYTVKVRSVNAGQYSPWSTICNFMTAITSYPWTEDFDSYTVSSGSTTHNLPVGWHYINTSTSVYYCNYPMVSNYFGYSGQYSLNYCSIPEDDPQDQYAILPKMENLGSKYVMLHAIGYDDTSFDIGLMTDPTDASTFVSFATQATTGTYKEYVFSIPSGATGNYIAIKMEKASSNEKVLFIDDIAVTNILNPVGLAATNATATTATLKWTERGNATAWQVCLNDDEGHLVDVASQSTCTLKGLTAETAYTVKVRSVNAGQYSPWSTICSFMTAIASYPWKEDFDSYTVDNWGVITKNLPVGWHYINTSTNSSWCVYPIVCNSGSNSGQNCLNFYSDSDYDPQDQYAILPPMENLGDKTIMFYAKNEYDDTSFDIGLMTDPTDANTFVSFATQATTDTYKEYFFSIPQNATGNYIAIKMEKAGKDDKVLFIDDITVKNLTEPTGLTVTAVTPTTATLTWTEQGNATAWQVCLNDDENHLIDVDSQPSHTLTDLDYSTFYTVKVRSAKNGQHGEWSDAVNFLTLEANPVPQDVAVSPTPTKTTISWTGYGDSYNIRYCEKPLLSEGFENGLGGWIRRDCGNNSNIYPNMSHSGGKSFRFAYSTSPTDQLLISPELTGISDNYKLELWYRNLDWRIEETFYVGFSSTTNETEAFTFGNKISTSDEQWHLYSETIPAGTKFICLKYVSNNYNLLIDDILIYKKTKSWMSCSTTEPTVTLTGLEKSTTYMFQIQSFLNGETSAWTAVSTFSTDFVPTDIAVSTTPTTATVSWTGKGDSYNVQYRYPEAIGEILLSQGFENGLDGWERRGCVTWSNIDGNYPHSGSKGFRFTYINASSPQYLISPELTGATEGTKLNFWYRSGDWHKETFCVGYSTTTNETDAFTFGNEISVSDQQWHLYSETIPAGTKYVCLKYTSNKYNLGIDDILIYQKNTEWTLGSTDEPQVTITGLTPSTTYEYRVQSVVSGDSSDWTDIATFTTMVENPVPMDVAVNNITAATATVSWTAYGDSYNVRYRRADHVGTTILTQGFENGLNGWTQRDCGNNSVVGTYQPYSGSQTYRFCYLSWGATLTHPQYLISPELTGVTEGTKLEFWYKNDDYNKAETFHVGTSTTGNATEDFTFGDEISASGKQWCFYSATIPDGTKYVCLKYTSNNNNLIIDDIHIYAEAAWTTVSTADNRVTVTGLEATTDYECQVQSIVGTKTSGWSALAAFTTNLLGDANGDGEVTTADVTAIINYIIGNPPANFNYDAANVNGDGRIDIVDVTGVINIIKQ